MRPVAAAVGKCEGKESVRGTATLSSNLSELDNLLAELSSSQFVPQDNHWPANCMILVFMYSVICILLCLFASPPRCGGQL